MQQPGGILHIPRGTFAVHQSLQLSKPVAVAPGGVLDVAKGATLTLSDMLSAGEQQVFRGGGRVVLRGGMPSLLVEWFGELC